MKKFYVILATIASVLCLCSCNGRTEKNAGKAVKEMYKEYRRVSKSDAIRYYKMKNNLNRIENMANEMNVCSQCGGYGIVYMVNEYGNYYTDYYGNPQVFICERCGGSGKRF